MPKDAAYFELLVKSRRVRRDTSPPIIDTKAIKIKSEMPQIGSLIIYENLMSKAEQNWQIAKAERPLEVAFLTTELFVSQGFDRIHLGGAVGRVEAEDDADDDRDAERERQ
jgi:hypothetical protein